MPVRRLALSLIALGTLLIVILIFSDLAPWLRGPAPETSEWYWPYLLRPMARWWPTALVAFGLLLLAARWLQRAEDDRRATVLALTALVVGSFLLQLALIYADRRQVEAELVDRTLSVRASGHFWTAAQVADLGEVLRDYPSAMSAFESEHARTHPPGLLIANWATIEGLARAPELSQRLAEEVQPLRCTDLWLYDQEPQVPAALAIWSVLPLVAAALAAIPAYWLARKLFEADAARLAAFAVATMPALLLFAPQSDQFYALLTLFTILALHIALERGSTGLFFVAGLLLSMSSFLTLGNAALLLPLLIYAGLWLWRGPESRPRMSQWLKWGVAFGSGAVLFWLFFWIGWGVPPWAIATTGLREHYELVTSQRAYGWWLFFNPVDLWTFVGLPWLAGFLWLLIRSLRSGLQEPAGWLATAIFVLMLLLNLSGSTRGEVGRLWLFFTPLIALLGGAFLARRFPERRARLLLLGMQLLLVIAIGLAWRPTQAVIVVAQEPAMPAVPDDFQAVGEPIGGNIVLRGYALNQLEDGSALDLTLVWHAVGAGDRPYTVFNHLLDGEGQVVAQHDGWPVEGQWPPSCWDGGTTVVDLHRIELPDDLPAGSYWLVTGFYDAGTGDRLLTTSGEDGLLLEEIQLDE